QLEAGARLGTGPLLKLGVDANGEAQVLRDGCNISRVARGELRDRERATRRLREKQLGEDRHYVARIGRRGALFRVDRWYPPEPWGARLHDSLHAAEANEQLERRQRGAGRRTP